MRRVDFRAGDAIRALQKAERCAKTEPHQWPHSVLNRVSGEQARAEAEEMLKPVGELMEGAGEVMHVDPTETGEFDAELATLYSTLEHPNMISVTASESRTEAAQEAGVLEGALDAAETARARNSLEKMLSHQMAAAHHAAMKLVARGLNYRLPAVDMARLTNAAARMMQVYQEAFLTLQKIRRGGKQTVVVQHVQVGGGGQAVIAGSMKAGDQRSKGAES